MALDFNSALARLVILLICVTVRQVNGLQLDTNSSTSVLSWSTNHLPDKMRTYGKGYYLTPEEEVALDKFRPLVENYALYPFLRRDNYLIKFLRARQMNIPAAADMYKAAMDWRKDRDIDNLIVKDYGGWEKLVPFIISGLDRTKSPIFYFIIGAYDIRKAVIAGKYDTLEQLFDRVFELGTRAGVHIFEETCENPGLAATLIFDMAGFNARQHACPRCLPIYAHIVSAYERYWPQVIRKMYFINTPRAFELVLEVIRPLMSPHTAKIYEIYGVDKNEWMPVLKRNIDADQLLVRYGGTRKLDSLSGQTYPG